MPYIIHLLIIIAIFLILSLGLQLAMGYGGILNFGHIGFFAIGAYTSALLNLAGQPFWLCFVAAGILGGISGLVLSLVSKKLRQDSLALATLAFSFVVSSVLLNWTGLTRGPLGLPGISRPKIFGFEFGSNLSFLLLSFVILAVVLVFVVKLVNCRFGKTIEAIRDNEMVAQSFSKMVFKTKTIVFIISGFLAGISGSLYAHYISFIDPSSFGLMHLIPILTIIIVGGMASWRGTVVATIALMLLPEALRFIDLPSSILGPARQMIYALLLILILYFYPRGILGKIDLK